MPKEWDTASQVPAVVRHIRSQSGATWKDKVKNWQANYNKNLSKGAPRLAVDGLVGGKTKKAMQNTSGPNDTSDYNQKGGGASGYLRNPYHTNKSGTSQSGKDLKENIKQISARRNVAANRNTNFGTAGQKTETLYERMKGDPGWAKRYREELKREAAKRHSQGKLVPVSSKKGIQSPAAVIPNSKKSYKSQAANAKNLRPWERTQLERTFTNNVYRTKPSKGGRK